MMDVVRNFINDKDYLITINQYGIYLKKYQRLLSLDHQYISFLCKEKKFVIKGEKLVLRKILEDEVFIEGNIISIEVYHV